MQTLKLKVSVRNHRIAEELPPEVPDGEAEVVIHYEATPAASVEQARRRHLEALFQDIDRSGEGKLTREQIDHIVAEERAAWGE
ncbi:MAG: hypothetical protein A3I01_16470 [Betaproteobacteria bacterium RIFCSPLOWO2_02_FULL_65_24]|nr:MAG: hypothetical protein A3I01_16470 [Betaproteobacteria bacterium RIFCSPLOWO2_02_FULL_65_24]